MVIFWFKLGMILLTFMFAIYWIGPCSLQTTCGLYWMWAASTTNGWWESWNATTLLQAGGVQALAPLKARAPQKRQKATEVIKEAPISFCISFWLQISIDQHLNKILNDFTCIFITITMINIRRESILLYLTH